MKFYKYVLLLGAVLIMGVFLTSTLAQSFSTPLYRPIVVVFGDSSEVETTVHTLVADYPQALVINYQDIHSLLSVLTLMRSHSPLILVGHGSEYGILGPNGAMISWQDIGTWVNTLPNTFVFFLVCDSSSATKFVQIPSHGFSGTIDGVLGAITVAANLQYANGNMQAVQQLISQYVSRVIMLQSDRTKIMPLICYNGPTQSSSSFSNTSSPNTICPPPPPPPPTYTVIFTESGLPSDTSWSVTLNGATKSARVDAAADPSSIYFGVNAGTYSYSVSAYGYSPTPSSGTVSVTGWDVSVSITFAPSSKTIQALFGGSCTITYSPETASIFNNPPQYFLSCMGPIEFFWDVGNILILIAGAILTFSSSFVSKYVGDKVSSLDVAVIGMLFNFLGAIIQEESYLAAGGSIAISAASLAPYLLTLIPSFMLFLLNVIVPSLPWEIQALAYSDIVVQFAVFVGTDGAAAAAATIIKATSILTTVLSAIWWILGVSSDISDLDDTANMPSWLFGGSG